MAFLFGSGGVVKIAYQGEPGAFSEAAARRIAPDAQLMPCKSFEDVFAAVEAGRRVRRPADRELDRRQHPPQLRPAAAHELPIVGEVELPVVHQLLALPGATLDGLRRVYSHPQALAQCERFLRTLNGVEIIATYDTAGSAKMVADDGLKDAGGDRVGARRRGVRPRLARRRRSRTSTTTSRASSSSARAPLPTGVADKTTIVFSLPNEPGSLFKALSVFALRGVDSDQARVAADPGPALGVPVLRRSGRGARRGARARARWRTSAEFAPMLRTLGSYASWKTPRRAAPDPFEVVS